MHAATVWQIALATDPDFLAPVASEFDVTEPLTEIPVISGLTPATDYLARARYIDDDGESSDFGPATAFTTLAEDTVQEPGVWADCVDP